MAWVQEWLLLTIAVGVGWLVGHVPSWLRRRRRKRIHDETTAKARLQFLFDHYSETAIEKFVQSLAVSIDTVAMHLSIGAHFRDRGETGKAILIHQNLLSHPELPSRVSDEVTYELALDYFQSGLLDRAEGLFLQLLRSKGFSRYSLRQLVQLYQQEKEWQKALDTASRLDRRDEPAVTKQLAHYHCELALAAQRRDDQWLVRKHLTEATRIDPACVRAALMLAEMLARNGHYRDARKHLLNAIRQEPGFLPDIVRALMTFDLADVRVEQRTMLEEIYAHHPDPSVLLAIAEDIRLAEGGVAAAAFLRGELERRPNLKGLLRLLELRLESPASSAVASDLSLVVRIGEMLLKARPRYRCRQCGFSGNQLHWLCPSCKTWESIVPVSGLESV